ncbi:MAG: DUF4292 domain-containing protein [Flavobacteriales bacterium AspAUS03]
MYWKKNDGFLLLVLLFLICACTGSKSLPSNKASLSQIGEIIHSYQIVHLMLAQNVILSGKIRIERKGQGWSAHTNIHIQPGEKIWIDASFLGFPIARALIIPEGILAYEKIQKTYWKGDFSLANQYLKTIFLDYTQLERLFLGQSLFELSSENYKLLSNPSDNLYTLTSINDVLIISTVKTIKGYTHTLEIDGSFCVRKESAKKIDTSEQLTITYDDWQKVGDQLFPWKIYIFVNEKPHPILSIEMGGIKINEPIDTSFFIPEGYKERTW